MLETLKNNKAALISSVAAVLAIIAVILYGTLSSDGETSPAVVFVLLIIAAVLQVLLVVFCNKIKDTPFVQTGVSLVQTALIGIALVVFLVARIDWLFALLSKMEVAPLTALFPVTIVFFALALITQVVAGFFSYKKSYSG